MDKATKKHWSKAGKVDEFHLRSQKCSRKLISISTIAIGVLTILYYFLKITNEDLDSRLSSTVPTRMGNIPNFPKPEAIHITELPLPPVSSNGEPGSCSKKINPNQTGCMGRNGTFQSGSFTPDGNYVTVTLEFVGAPAPPHPASIYTGEQVIVVRINGTFSNGDTWKCVTCGVLEKDRVGAANSLGYVQAFRDGKRLLAGTHIVECEYDLADDRCTPANTKIVPIIWDSAGQGAMRELRLHPDQEHVAWSSFFYDPPNWGQYGYIGRLQKHVAVDGSPRYDLTDTWLMVDTKGKPSLYIEGDEIKTNPEAIVIGEIRGFSGTGQELTYLGAPVESGNADVFAVNLITGRVRRITSHPEYVDPVDISPDDNWTVVMDTRGSNRQMFLSGMRGIPPLTDLITFAAICSVRNNGERRFFQPYLIDRHGDRGSYSGQKINAEGSGVAGSGAINDPEWNGLADPRWSLDGNRIVYSQRLTVTPACGGNNPLPCYESTADGGRTARVMLATLTERRPYNPPHVVPFDDVVPWAVKYIPGMQLPQQHSLPPGHYILRGKASGHADVAIETSSVAVTYRNFSDDNVAFLDGQEKVFKQDGPIGSNVIDWYSDITQSGAVKGTKRTSPDGFHMSIDVFENKFEANGTLIIVVDGTEYHQPANGT